MKLCKDCKYHKESYRNSKFLWFKKSAGKFSKCVAPVEVVTSMVTGKTTITENYCESQRSKFGACKPAALLWEAKK